MELTGTLKTLVCSKSRTGLCFISSEGEGFDAETIEELIIQAGFNLSEVEGKRVEIALHIES